MNKRVTHLVNKKSAKLLICEIVCSGRCVVASKLKTSTKFQDTFLFTLQHRAIWDSWNYFGFDWCRFPNLQWEFAAAMNKSQHNILCNDENEFHQTKTKAKSTESNYFEWSWACISDYYCVYMYRWRSVCVSAHLFAHSSSRVCVSVCMMVFMLKVNKKKTHSNRIPFHQSLYTNRLTSHNNKCIPIHYWYRTVCYDKKLRPKKKFSRKIVIDVECLCGWTQVR